MFILNTNIKHKLTRSLHSLENSIFIPDSDITYNIASLDYNMNICTFIEITPMCGTDYVISAIKTQRLSPGNCGCFRQDMDLFLYEKCLGVQSCTMGYAEMKVDTNIYPPPPTEFCWFRHRIIYTCEPGKNNTIYWVLHVTHM